MRRVIRYISAASLMMLVAYVNVIIAQDELDTIDIDSLMIKDNSNATCRHMVFDYFNRSPEYKVDTVRDELGFFYDEIIEFSGISKHLSVSFYDKELVSFLIESEAIELCHGHGKKIRIGMRMEDSTPIFPNSASHFINSSNRKILKLLVRKRDFLIDWSMSLVFTNDILASIFYTED